MTTLDHSSVNALVAHILGLCRSGPTRRRFCFFAAGGLKSMSWRFLSVFVKSDELWLRVEYDMPNGVTVEHALLKGGRLFFVDGPAPDIGYVVGATVGSEPPCGGSSSADDSQRRRLNKNLRGVFA